LLSGNFVIHSYKGDHPFPTETNIDATRKITELLKGLTSDDFVLFIVSGGGSSLLCQPGNFTCGQETEITKRLEDSGADIHEINIVRKHLSLARGGYLAKYAYPARSLALIFVDIPDRDISYVASGPTIKDTTTVEDARRIIDKYRIDGTISPDDFIETPKDDIFFEKAAHLLFVSNSLGLGAMAAEANAIGYSFQLVTGSLTGNASQTGQHIVKTLAATDGKTALIYGGETTVIVKKPGKGGRNQELVLSALRFIREGQIIAAVNTDGRDNTDFAGALGDRQTLLKAHKLNLAPERFLVDNESYDFFEKTGDYIKTGPTGANVSDFIVALKE